MRFRLPVLFGNLSVEIHSINKKVTGNWYMPIPGFCILQIQFFLYQMVHQEIPTNGKGHIEDRSNDI